MSSQTLTTRLDGIENRLDTMSTAIAELLRVQTECKPKNGRTLRLTEAQRRELERHRAFQMRVAKAAKRVGLTVSEFKDRYPGSDRVP